MVHTIAIAFASRWKQIRDWFGDDCGVNMLTGRMAGAIASKPTGCRTVRQFVPSMR